MTTFLSPCVLDAMPANKTLYCIKQTVCDHVNRMWKNWVIQDFFLFRIYWWIEGFIFQLVACLYWNFVKSWSFWWVPVGQCGSYGCPRRLGLGPQRPSQRNAGKLSFYFATLASSFKFWFFQRILWLSTRMGEDRVKREKRSRSRDRDRSRSRDRDSRRERDKDERRRWKDIFLLKN